MHDVAFYIGCIDGQDAIENDKQFVLLPVSVPHQ
jgi:hypothetical protein